MDNKEFIKLINISSRIDTDILISQLEAAGIVCMVKTPGAGDYLNILGYGSALGQDIYVTRDDYETAIKIAEEYKTSDIKDLGSIRRIRQIFAILVLLGYIFGIVMSILN